MGKFNCKLLKSFFLILFLISVAFGSNAQTIKLGIFHKPNSHKIVVKAKSDVNISSSPAPYITNTMFTIRWSAESNIAHLDSMTCFLGCSLQGDSGRLINGNRYATFAGGTAPQPFNWVAGTEYTLLEFGYSSQGCASFVLADDEDARLYQIDGGTYQGEYYFEIGGNWVSSTDSSQYFYEDSVIATPGIAMPTVAGTTDGLRCGTGAVNLSAAPSSLATIKWYSGLTGGTSLSSSNNYTTPSIPTTTNYYVDASRYGCYSSPRNQVIASVYPVVTAAAGSDQSSTGTWTATLNADPPSPNSGVWSVVPGAGSLAFNPDVNANNAQITSDSYNTYKLKWTVSSAHCSATDTVQIAFNAPSVSTFNGTENWYTFANWTNGVPDAITEAIINGDVTVNANARCNKLNINETGKVTINTSDTLKVFNNFLLKSSVSGTGSIIDNGKLNVLGSITAQRFIPSITKYSFVSSPVTSALSRVFQYAWLYKWNEPTQYWDSIVRLNVPLEPMKGYSLLLHNDVGTQPPIPPDNPAIFTGTLNTGAIGSDNNLTNTDGADANLEGYNLVGNPYPSAIDWEASGWTKTNVDNAIYFWANNQYASYVDDAGNNGGSRYIPAMQGFFVRRTHSSFGTGTLKMGNSVRVHNSTAFYKAIPQNFLSLKVSGNSLSDETVIRFKNVSTNSFDSQYDAYKLFGYKTPQLYTIAEDATELSINTLTEVVNNTRVNMSFKPSFNGSYTITASELNSFEQDIFIYLEDNKTQQSQLLNTNPVYTFTADILDATNRFIVKFLHSNNSITEIDNNNLIVFASGKTVYINAKGAVKDNLNVEVIDLLGRKVTGMKIASSNINEIQLNAISGYYIVRVVGDKTNQSTKVFIN